MIANPIKAPARIDPPTILRTSHGCDGAEAVGGDSPPTNARMV